MIIIEIHDFRQEPGSAIFIEGDEKEKELVLKAGEKITNDLERSLKYGFCAYQLVGDGTVRDKYHYCIRIEYPTGCSFVEIEEARRITEGVIKRFRKREG